MDGNKNEAVKCLKIGKEALEAGDKTRALRFLSKARRLDPTVPIDDLLSSIDAEESNGPECGPTESPSPHLRARSSASSKDKAATSSGEPVRAVYSEEHVTIVRQIKKENDYYQILGLERTCTVEDVRKAYRKLSLKVHPDKNKAPGAEEAFKAVSKAFQCLSSEESRKRYDLVGSEEPVQQHRSAARHDHFGFHAYETEFDADEIFRNFFFGGMSPATAQFGTYRFRTGGMGMPRDHHANANATGSSGLRTLIQVLPVILLLLLNFLPSSDPPYSLTRSYPYDMKMETMKSVPFYVKSRKFEENYPHGSAERMTLEERIEKEYVSIVSQNCRVELQRQQWGWGGQTPHCDLLRKYEAAAS